MTEPRYPADKLLTIRKKHWPESVTAVGELIVRVYRLNSLMQDSVAEQIATHGLSFMEFEVLITLRGVAPPYEMIPTELYPAILISSGGLTKVLNALQERGLITRAEGTADKRSKPVRLTAKGRTLAERVMAEVLESGNRIILGGLSEAEVERATRLLHKLLATLEPVRD
ncbi:MAG TPA: MarR family transcriptional regulator [Bradyrhizobium sp.]